MKKIEETCKQLLNDAVIGARDGWPPVCMGIFYQPERPEMTEAQKTEESDH